MKKVIIKVVVTTVGSILLVLGVLGLFLPVLQGILFILAGLTLLSTEYHWPSKIINKFKRHFEKVKEENEDRKNNRDLKKKKRAAAKATRRLNKIRNSEQNEDQRGKKRS
jgi:uncharacterized membrane protein YbaN (DUF454 family)